ncbi:MAG: aminotransferase class V-fold PLP-dependent enzyme [Verrucomicrobia bacterium]|nr:aminotransferase class V-fold PLP-dependent enzyme [Verrucomicrobiota bacterium]
MNKREFIRTMAVTGLAATAAGRHLTAHATEPAVSAPRGPTDFWDGIRAQYRLDPARVNFENGYYCIMPEPVLEATLARMRDQNLSGSYYLRTRMEDDRLAVRRRLAEFAGCAAEELIVTRNTTESLDTVIAGFDWRAGDEAVMAVQDYGSMLDMFRVQARRHGIVNRMVSLPRHPASDDEIVQLYERALGPRTRLLMVSHLVNITGQILPVRKLCAMAHAHGVPVMVDGAHTFAHLDFQIPDLGCDFYGASLHKWLGAPLGHGLLYVRRDRIADLWPLFGETNFADDDIRKLNHLGTHPVPTELAILDALDFHQRIGSARKEARLRQLQERWTSQVRGVAGLTVNTPADPARACAIANVRVDRLSPAALAQALLEQHRIWTVAIDSDAADVHGVRVTPNLFSTLDEVDRLAAALRALA